MSQAGGLSSNGGGGIPSVQTLTGNTGGAVPPTGNNINVVGTGAITVAGNPGTSTLTISSSAAGNLVLIQSQSVSSVASVAFTSGITATYNSYLFVISNVLAASNNDALALTVSNNGGSSYAASGYTHGISLFVEGTGSLGSQTSTTQIFLTYNQTNTATDFASGTVYCFNVTSSNQSSYVGTLSEISGSNNVSILTSGQQNSITNINAFKFSFGSGNIVSGTFTLYGILE